jgi:hypothetical protein
MTLSSSLGFVFRLRTVGLFDSMPMGLAHPRVFCCELSDSDGLSVIDLGIHRLQEPLWSGSNLLHQKRCT